MRASARRGHRRTALAPTQAGLSPPPPGPAATGGQVGVAAGGVEAAVASGSAAAAEAAGAEAELAEAEAAERAAAAACV